MLFGSSNSDTLGMSPISEVAWPGSGVVSPRDSRDGGREIKAVYLPGLDRDAVVHPCTVSPWPSGSRRP
jgi:hypothetical protein